MRHSLSYRAYGPLPRPEPLGRLARWFTRLLIAALTLPPGGVR